MPCLCCRVPTGENTSFYTKRYTHSIQNKLQQTFLRFTFTRLLFSFFVFFTRHSLVERRARYLFYCMFFCLFGQRFLDNPRADSRHQSSHAGVLWFRMCFLPFWGLAAPGGRKKGQMKFSLLWDQWGNFCILAVFERYLSNTCTDPHQILYVYGQYLPTCPLPLWDPSAPGGRGEGELKTQKIGGGLIRAADSYHFYFSQRCQMWSSM